MTVVTEHMVVDGRVANRDDPVFGRLDNVVTLGGHPAPKRPAPRASSAGESWTLRSRAT
jgi:hypothetical protein